MDIASLDHVALICADINVSKNWYIKVFDMEWIHQELWDGNPIFLRKGNCCLALFQTGSDRSSAPKSGARIDHFAFKAETRDGYEAAKRKLQELNIPFKEQDHEIAHSIYLRDPDQISVEITTYAT